MKRLSVALLLLGLTGCSYPSRLKAIEACEDWVAETPSVVVSRWCEDDSIDNQILGYEGRSDANGLFVAERFCKHFRY
jgi:hypothetical protein